MSDKPRNNAELVQHLRGNSAFFNLNWPLRRIELWPADHFNFILDEGNIQSDQVEEAMLATDRGFYSPHEPYMDFPQSIGYAATISAPHMVIF